MSQTTKKIFVDDIGITFRVYAGNDISTATSIIMKVKKPNSDIVSWTASLAGDNNYYAIYQTISGDLNLQGEYRLSLEVVTPNVTLVKGSTAKFTVYKQFEDQC